MFGNAAVVSDYIVNSGNPGGSDFGTEKRDGDRESAAAKS